MTRQQRSVHNRHADNRKLREGGYANNQREADALRQQILREGKSIDYWMKTHMASVASAEIVKNLEGDEHQTDFNIIVRYTGKHPNERFIYTELRDAILNHNPAFRRIIQIIQVESTEGTYIPK